METDDKLKLVINSIHNGEMESFFQEINNSDFGLYIPVYEDKKKLKPMLNGYSQVEQNLKVSVIKKNENNLKDTFVVGWFGKINGKDTCCHGHPALCKGHSEDIGITDVIEAPKLDYYQTVKQIYDKEDLLNSLMAKGLGITLLHSHNSQFMFTKLPIGYVSVIVNGITTFRKETDVLNDPTFIPTCWRSINNKIHIAGGYSEML